MGRLNHHHWWKPNISRSTKQRIFNTLVGFVMIYGAEIWHASTATLKAIIAFQTKTPRRIEGYLIFWVMRNCCSSPSSHSFLSKQLSVLYDGFDTYFECPYTYPQRWSLTLTLPKPVGSNSVVYRRNDRRTAFLRFWRWQTWDWRKNKCLYWTEVYGGGRRHSQRRAAPGRRSESSKSNQYKVSLVPQKILLKEILFLIKNSPKQVISLILRQGSFLVS